MAKVKSKPTTPKVNPVDGMVDELMKLGFTGAELNAGRSAVKVKREYYFHSLKRSDLRGVQRTDKKSKAVTLSVMRMRVEPEFEISVTWDGKVGKVTWDYETAAQQKLAMSSGMHTKLVKILGSQK